MDIPNEAFLADLDTQPGLAVDMAYAYWLGVTAACPANQIDCAGLHFPKMQERIIPDPNRPGEHVRVPVIGGLDRHVTRDKLDALREIVSRLVIRFIEAPEAQEEPGTGENIGDVVRRARKGYVITIPTEAQIQAAKDEGRTLRRYTRQPHDEPAAKYMYMRLCEDQTDPQRGLAAPPTLAEVGVSWPDGSDAPDEGLME